MYQPAGRVRLAVVSPDSSRQTYVTGLAAGRSKTVTGIVREVLPAQGERALNKYDWDEDQLNHERLEELQTHGKTRWSQDGYIVIDDSMFQRIETFFEDSKQNLVLGDCEVRNSDGASRHWHLQMLTYSLLRLDPESSVSERLASKASSLRAQLEHGLKEAIYNMVSWIRDQSD